ncbi:hypothetical protein HMPREF0972_00874 [Actinomyces sp. oral taxon 848 str. F0332]|nr:hypothetical protein HMPREF0972_00874 [Actinomyces sp. oral taxon 848 str. F0332]
MDPTTPKRRLPPQPRIARRPLATHPENRKPPATEGAHNVKTVASAISTGRSHPGPPSSSLTDHFQPDPPPSA